VELFDEQYLDAQLLDVNRFGAEVLWVDVQEVT
jgi:hypothetical protein